MRSPVLTYSETYQAAALAKQKGAISEMQHAIRSFVHAFSSEKTSADRNNADSHLLSTLPVRAPELSSLQSSDPEISLKRPLFVAPRWTSEGAEPLRARPGSPNSERSESSLNEDSLLAPYQSERSLPVSRGSDCGWPHPPCGSL